MHLAEGDAVQALDEGTHALERPQLSAKAVRQCALQQRHTQAFELAAVQLRRPPRGHRAQRFDAAFIESRFPRVRRLPSHTHRFGRFGWRLAGQHQPPCAHSLACGFVHSRHVRTPRSTQRSENAPRANRLSCL
jgi:hypothetical protein